VIRRNVIASPACDQHDARADLAASFVSAKPLSNGNMRYTLLVRNLGLSAATGFSVSMRVNGTEPPTVRVASLGARKSRLVTFTAAGCASGSKMHFEADFSKELAEPNEANNVAEIACPVVGG
jgi:subtilase family serine protease